MKPSQDLFDITESSKRFGSEVVRSLMLVSWTTDNEGLSLCVMKHKANSRTYAMVYGTTSTRTHARTTPITGTTYGVIGCKLLEGRFIVKACSKVSEGFVISHKTHAKSVGTDSNQLIIEKVISFHAP